MARWYVNPLVKESRMLWNPRRRRHHRNNHRRRHHRRNPDLGGITSLMKNPGTMLADGLATGLGAYWSISLPGMFGLGFAQGTDLISKLLRAGVRAATGGLLYTGARRFAPHYSSSVLSGAMLAAGGGFLFDLMGWNLVIGAGDTQQAGLLPGAIGMPSFGAYTRPQLGAYRSNIARYGAYTRPQLGAYTRHLGAFAQRHAGFPHASFAGFYGGGGNFYG